MSRFIGNERNSQPVLEIANKWKSTCLLNEGSIFGKGQIWTLDNLNELLRYYVNNLDEGEGNFLDKLQKQLENVTPQARILCAEMMWVMLLCPGNIGPESKRSTIGTILSWADESVDSSEPFFDDVVLAGVGSGGTAYSHLRWLELVYFVNVMSAFHALPYVEKEEILTNALKFTGWLESIEDNNNRQFRHMLLYLLFPDEKERIFGKGDRQRIVAAFSGTDLKAVKKLSPSTIDDELARLRKEQEDIYSTDQLDWYSPPLRAFWLNTAKKGETESQRIFPVLQEFLEQAKTQNLKTNHFPASHAGLNMRISFGAGNQAHVPWIGFLADGQTPTKGIYPVYLYYKQDNLLILAKGVSTTNSPEHNWTDDDLMTIKSYFLEEFNKEPIRHGESFICQAYSLDEPLNEESIEIELAELLQDYKELVGVLEDQDENDTDVSYAQETTTKVEGVIAEPLPKSLEDILEGVFLPLKEVKNIVELLGKKKNIVLQGPPGVGKTYISKRLAYALMGCEDSTRVEMIQFHQNYAYEDFVQGYRPGDNGFDLKNGLFHQFCEKARANPEKPYVFIIDEINRGNLSKIFGELMMLIEADKRGKNWQVALTYSKDLSEKFFVPENVHLIGLMNTADRSLSLVDYALRRRFAFINLEPAFDSEGFTRQLSKNGSSEGMTSKVIARLNSLNKRISDDISNLGPGFRIGHSFFCSPSSSQIYDDNWFEEIIRYEIQPLLEEYWFDNPNEVKKTLSELLA